MPGPGAASAGEVVSGYLHDQAATFLRALSLRAEDEDAANLLLRRSARRISATLQTYGPLTEPAWADPLRTELGWLSTALAHEHQYAARLARLLSALHRLASGPDRPNPGRPGPAALPWDHADGAPAADRTALSGRSGPSASSSSVQLSASGGPLAVGAARAGALLERQLTLARTRAHSAALQALGSSRFHALADAVAVLASEVPLTPAADAPAADRLPPLAGLAHHRLAEATAALPLARAGHPYNADAVRAALGPELTNDLQDAPWHHARALLRISRYAAEVCPAGEPGTMDTQEAQVALVTDGADGDGSAGSGQGAEDALARLKDAARLLEGHREAAESANAVSTAARIPRIAPATAYALGVLHADQRQEVEAARFAFARLWQRGVPGVPAVPAAPGSR
ncbi:CHAD domain-containing protein [Streptomyces sp. H10-C2]|uniref:CHAD domain-containing protein n=1 Tax=unclassified Streptomyces TaxID=2593676 RepID=UPI0024B991D0|nr:MULTISPECIES: CHAD domain-containing protein [unclassified Streptomyces]MDJ0345101.1 CHAD domain-containing protein [Streptomyces sp. PH10-H1]MDJ0374006.1 CHAD domain-containing protein [Streptomyces sp. H10-C2]